MKRKKKERYYDLNASLTKTDTFGTIFDSMLKHDSFLRLSPTAKLLYIYCRNQAQSKEGKTTLYNHGNEYNIQYAHDTDFVFPAKHLKEYGLDRRNADKYFKELIAAGFLVKRECNKVRYKVNIYSFSDKWKNTS